MNPHAKAFSLKQRESRKLFIFLEICGGGEGSHHIIVYKNLYKKNYSKIVLRNTVTSAAKYFHPI
ncbi:MAG: hypothetical protein ABFS18_09050 [Thermodesulfobacteriota bacterium]